MTTQDLHFGQRVTWINAKGAVIVAEIVNIAPRRPFAQIRVRHEGGVQQLWVHVAALTPLVEATP